MKKSSIVLDTHTLSRMQKAIAKSFATPTPTPTPPLLPDPDIATHPFQRPGAIRGLRLGEGKARYYIGLPHPFLGVLKECGAPMVSTRHILEIYTVPLGATLMREITERRPIAQIFTLPFYFHDETEAIRFIAKALIEIVDILPQ